jgi:uncharacterized protein
VQRPIRAGLLPAINVAGIRTPTLIVQEKRDPFGGKEDVAVYMLSPKIRVAWMQDGDHDFKPRKASGRTQEQNWDAAIEEIVAFLKSNETCVPSSRVDP